MRSNKKIQHNQLFVEGMNTVTSPEFASDKQYEYMLNCNVVSTAVGNVGKVTNKKGNTKIQVALPEGLNRTIGCVNDEEKNVFYYAVWNSLGYHTWYQYNSVSNNIVKVIQNLTDTEDVSVFNWLEDELILHANIIANKLLYWVIKGDTARKINIQKCLNNEYGPIREIFTRAYKRTALSVPVATYTSDTSRPFNRLYGYQYKFAVRFRYDDNEISHVSGFSNVPLPGKEPYRGISVVPTENNCIEVQVETGSRIVNDIEILMTRTDSEGFILGWFSVAVLNKKKLSISDNSIYTFKFYNDGAYPVVPQQEIDNPYSFLPRNPETQDFGKNSLIYGNFSEGFENVIVDAELELLYEDLFVESGTINELNNPFFDWNSTSSDYIESKSTVKYYDGTNRTVYRGYRFNKQTIFIGGDVKKGNKFELYLQHGGGQIYSVIYTANYNDSVITVYNEVVRQLIATGRIYRQTPEISDTSIYDYSIDTNGVLSFSYIMRGFNDYIRRIGQSVNPVSFNSLKDTGQSVATTKLGSTGKVAIVYEDEDGRKSLGYTDDSLFFSVKTLNETQKFQTVTFQLSLNHIPPIDAYFWYPVFSDDLTYGNFIQMLIQKVYSVPYVAGDDGEYLDLNIGSLLTYKKIHENTNLKYEFKKGDRLRLIKSLNLEAPLPEDIETFYDFFEAEIISYKPILETKIDSKITVNGTTSVTVAETSQDYIGLNIRINGVERRIVSAPSATEYIVNNPYPGDGVDGTDDVNYPTYEILNYNGVIRIKKPSTPVILDNSIVEIFSPSLSIRDELQGYWDLGYRFPVINPGTDNRLHGGDVNQTTSTPAVVSVRNNNVYVRNREMPVSNTTPNTQVYITPIEDPSFSDFYVSNFTDRGRKFVADIGAGKVKFGSRLRHSSNYIEDTRINGLNYFFSLEREDYNDDYGDIQRISVDGDVMFVYKQLRTGYVMMGRRVLSQADGEQLIATTTKLLSDINYYAWEGGIGNNPEAFVKNNTSRYHLSPNSGVVIRLGRDGETPISEIYYLDNKIREYISESQKNGSRIYFSFDRFTGNLIITFEGSNKYIFVNNNDFNVSSYKILDELPPEETTYTIVTSPENGTLDLTNPKFPIYTSNPGFVGNDEFTYSAVIDGETITRKVCISVEDLPAVLEWRAKESSAYCIEESGDNTGFKAWTTLEQINIIGNVVTGLEKPNVTTDPDYVEPVYDLTSCPLPSVFTVEVKVDALSASISSVTGIPGFSITGTLNYPDSQYGTHGSIDSGDIVVTLDSGDFGSGVIARLYINGILTRTVNNAVTSATFTSVSVNSTDLIYILLIPPIPPTMTYTLDVDNNSPNDIDFRIRDNTNFSFAYNDVIPTPEIISDFFTVIDDGNTMRVSIGNTGIESISYELSVDGVLVDSFTLSSGEVRLVNTVKSSVVLFVQGI